MSAGKLTTAKKKDLTSAAVAGVKKFLMGAALTSQEAHATQLFVGQICSLGNERHEELLSALRREGELFDRH